MFTGIVEEIGKVQSIDGGNISSSLYIESFSILLIKNTRVTSQASLIAGLQADNDNETLMVKLNGYRFNSVPVKIIASRPYILPYFVSSAFTIILAATSCR